ncbi:MAG: ankyrin repeat domain-containing protein, partial [Armatimonadetes bacterium]|nr:ankyrin repeat domain-containing protein [Armatimonadota bacterium]
LVNVAHTVDSPVSEKMAHILLERNADVNFRGSNGVTALIYASVQNKSELVDMLLAFGADVNARDDDTETVLMWAAGAGNADIVHRLIVAGADVNANGDLEGTALKWAVKSGSTDTVRLLIEHGADIYAPSAFTASIHQRLVPIIELFLSHGFDIQRDLRDGYNALELALKSGHGDIVRLLKHHQTSHQ